MHIKSVIFNDFKRFKNTSIVNITLTSKLIILVGPNGSGKSSVFDGFLQWTRITKFGTSDEKLEYYIRNKEDWADRQSVA